MSVMADQRRRRRHSGESEFSDDNETLTGKQSYSKKADKSEGVSSDDNEETDSDSVETGSESGDEDVLIEYEEVESALNGERQRGDGEEQPDNLDDDEDRQNPAYIPRQGAFYEHDTRSDSNEKAHPTDVRREKKKLWEDKGRWCHDHYTDEQQAPKSREQIIVEYGYDIRAYNEAPAAPKTSTQPKRGRDRRNKFGDFIDTGASGDGPHNDEGPSRRPRGRARRGGQQGSRGGAYTRDRRDNQSEWPPYAGKSDSTPDQRFNRQSDRPVDRRRRSDPEPGHKSEGDNNNVGGEGQRGYNVRGRGAGSRMMPPQPPRQWTNSGIQGGTTQGGQGDGRWDKPAPSPPSQSDWAAEVERTEMQQGVKSYARERHKKVGRTRVQDENEWPRSSQAENTDVAGSESVKTDSVVAHRRYGPERVQGNRRGRRPPAPGQMESIVPPTTSVVTTVPASSADVPVKLSDSEQPPANRPKRYSSQRQRPLAEPTYSEISDVSPNHRLGHQPTSQVGPPTGQVGPPTGQVGPPTGQAGLSVGQAGPHPPISNYYRPVYATQPPPIYHSRPDCVTARHSYPAGHVPPPIVQPQMGFPLPGGSGAPRMFPPTGPPPPPTTMAPPCGPPLSTFITTPVLNYVPSSGQPPPFALQGHIPVPYQPAQVGPAPQSQQQQPPDGVQMRGGTVYFNPEVQQPNMTRSPVRRIKVAIPIVNPQDGQQQNYDDMLPDGTTVQAVGGGQSYYQIVSVPSDSYYVEAPTSASDMVVYEPQDNSHAESGSRGSKQPRKKKKSPPRSRPAEDEASGGSHGYQDDSVHEEAPQISEGEVLNGDETHQEDIGESVRQVDKEAVDVEVNQHNQDEPASQENENVEQVNQEEEAEAEESHIPDDGDDGTASADVGHHEDDKIAEEEEAVTARGENTSTECRDLPQCEDTAHPEVVSPPQEVGGKNNERTDDCVQPDDSKNVTTEGDANTG